MAPVSIWITEGFADEADALRQALGGEYTVTVGRPTGAGIAVVPAQGTAAMAFLHARYPEALCLVVDRRHPHLSATEALDAGADGYVCDWSVPVVAAHLVALGRRLARAQGRLAAS